MKPAPTTVSDTSTNKTHKNIYRLGAVSLLNDTASEMIYPLLPVFLKSVLGVGAGVLGVIEGLAETTAAITKYFSGAISDRLRKRKAIAAAGYTLSIIVRPLIGLAQTTGAVLGFRLADRLGKGIRTAPRDALLADSVSADRRGFAFGVQRAMDHAGAVIGPLVVAGLFALGMTDLRTIFLLSAIPGAAAVIVLVLGVREVRPSSPDLPAVAASSPDSRAGLPRSFYAYLVAVGVFALGNSTDAFLLLRATDLGVSTILIPLLWAAHHLAKSVLSVPGGVLADRIPRRVVIIAGWGVYAAVYLGFALAKSAVAVWTLFVVYGLYFALTEGVEKALVADFAGPEVRGKAYGWYHLAVGLAAAPASILFGVVWTAVSPTAAFLMGAGLAAAAALVLLVIPLPRRK